MRRPGLHGLRVSMRRRRVDATTRQSAAFQVGGGVKRTATLAGLLAALALGLGLAAAGQPPEICWTAGRHIAVRGVVDFRSAPHTGHGAGALRGLSARGRAHARAGGAGLRQPADPALSGRIHAVHGHGEERRSPAPGAGHGQYLRRCRGPRRGVRLHGGGGVPEHVDIQHRHQSHAPAHRPGDTGKRQLPAPQDRPVAGDRVCLQRRGHRHAHRHAPQPDLHAGLHDTHRHPARLYRLDDLGPAGSRHIRPADSTLGHSRRFPVPKHCRSRRGRLADRRRSAR